MILYYVILELLYNIIYYIILHCIILLYDIILYYITSYYIIWYYIIFYFIISYYIILYHIIGYDMIWYYILLYYMLYFIILYLIILLFIDVHMQYTFINNITHTWTQRERDIYIYVWYSCFSEIFESLRDENRPRPENWAERKGAGVLGPTKADWGQAWLSLAP